MCTAIASLNKKENNLISFSKRGLLKSVCDQCLWRVFSFAKPGLVENRLQSEMGKDTLEPKLEASHFPLKGTLTISTCWS